MNERFVTSLALSKKLEEAGVPQKSEFYWFQHYSPEGSEGEWAISHHEDGDFEIVEGFTPSAWTSGELGEMLPNEVKDKGGKYYGLQMKKNSLNEWAVYYTRYPAFSDLDLCSARETSEAEARGKLLLHLLTSGLLSVSGDVEEIKGGK